LSRSRSLSREVEQSNRREWREGTKIAAGSEAAGAGTKAVAGARGQEIKWRSRRRISKSRSKSMSRG
jgi:hypothetical protein